MLLSVGIQLQKLLLEVTHTMCCVELLDIFDIQRTVHRDIFL